MILGGHAPQKRRSWCHFPGFYGAKSVRSRNSTSCLEVDLTGSRFPIETRGLSRPNQDFRIETCHTRTMHIARLARHLDQLERRIECKALGSMNECPLLGSCKGSVDVRLWVRSDVGSFCELQCVFHINTKVAHRALNLGMPQQDLNRPQVARRFVDE